jgi:3-oxoacyl-[acyl-carrier-protein] synthase II
MKIANKDVSEKIIISGVGVISPLGVGKDIFWNGLRSRSSGIKGITRFDTSDYLCKSAGQVDDFNPKDILGKDFKIRNLDRPGIFACAAAQLARRDAGFEGSEESTYYKSDRVGVVVGNTYGSLNSTWKFFREALRHGYTKVSPAEFPNTVINSASSRVAIQIGSEALCLTISNGNTSSVDAIDVGMNYLKINKADMILSGGVEELCEENFRISYYNDRLRHDLIETFSNDFENDRYYLGEGAAIFVMERMESALARNSRIYAEIVGYGTEFNSDIYSERLQDLMERVLDESELKYTDLDWISYNVQGRKGATNNLEFLEKGLSRVKSTIAVNSLRDQLGNCYSADGALQLAEVLCSFQYPLHADYYWNGSTLQSYDKIQIDAIHTGMILSHEPGGASSCLVVKRYSGVPS